MVPAAVFVKNCGWGARPSGSAAASPGRLTRLFCGKAKKKEIIITA